VYAHSASVKYAYKPGHGINNKFALEIINNIWNWICLRLVEEQFNFIFLLKEKEIISNYNWFIYYEKKT